MGSCDSIALALARAVRAARRADRANRAAAQHELLAAEVAGRRARLHWRLALMYRSDERRHRAAVMLHCHHVNKLWRRIGRESGSARPLMSAVANTAEARGAAISVVGTDRSVALTATSGPLAEAAHTVEWTLGQGPGQDILTHRSPLRAAGRELSDRWPLYGPAVADLGVRTVAAAPLEVSSTILGALTVFDPPADTPVHDGCALVALADALTRAIISDLGTAAVETLVAPLLDDAEDHTVVYQATGMVAAQCDCTVADALALIRARAHSLSTSIDLVARWIVDGAIRLDDISDPPTAI